MRYWSLIRMLYCPLRSSLKASRRLLGGMSRSVTEISDCLRGVQSGQTAQGDRSHIGELFDALPLEKGFGLLVSEAPDHNMEGIACYVVRQAYRRTGYRGTAASLC